MSEDTPQAASTPAPVAALAQTRDTFVADVAPPAARPAPGGFPLRHAIGPGVTRTVARAAAPQRGLPLYRPLRIYTSDPSASRLEGAVTSVKVRCQ